MSHKSMFDRDFFKNDPFFGESTGLGRIDTMFNDMKNRMNKMMSDAHSR